MVQRIGGVPASIVLVRDQADWVRGRFLVAQAVQVSVRDWQVAVNVRADFDVVRGGGVHVALHRRHGGGQQAVLLLAAGSLLIGSVVNRRHRR